MAGLLNPDDLAKMEHARLYMLREKLKSKQDQNALAGYEHRAFAREAVGDNPLMALPIAASIPLYQLSKMIPGLESRSDASWGQTGQGLLGIGEGLARFFRR